MKKIRDKFRKNGFEYTLLKRTGNVAIYEQFKDFNGEGVGYAYEVHKVRLNPPATCKYEQSDGSLIVVERPESESLASNEEFGTYGWSFDKEVNAMKLFNQLVNSDEN